MFNLKFLVFFTIFIQIVPSMIDLVENDLYTSEMIKCVDFMALLFKMETAEKCLARNSLLSKEKNEFKCCFYSFKKDPMADFKKKYGENWKKIVAQSNGYDLNISEEEIRKKLTQNVKEEGLCQLTMKSLNTSFLYLNSMLSLDGIVKYDCGEGQKTFNKNEFRPKSKDEIIDKELFDSTIANSEKDCLKNGAKLSVDDYQMCWCEKVPLSSGPLNEKECLAFKTSTFQERLKKQMNRAQKDNSKEEYKCTCSNNKNKTIKGRFNSVTGEVKVE